MSLVIQLFRFMPSDFSLCFNSNKCFFMGTHKLIRAQNTVACADKSASVEVIW